MEKLKFKFTVLAASDGKTNLICIVTIETPDGRVYDVPDELKPVSKHASICSSAVFTKIKNSLKRRHQSRQLWIILTDELRKTYLDEGENVQFGDQYLEEVMIENKPTINDHNGIEPGHKNFGKIAEKFLLEKFSAKTSNVDQWIQEFEEECERHDILQDAHKIEMLKHIIEKQCLDWYTSMLIKMTINSEWTLWKESLCETYGNKGWSQIKYAFGFKFQVGSLLEYATKKERLLLEVNKQIDKQTMINLIVMGLPDYIIDKIDKGSVSSVASLYNEIGKHEHSVYRKNYNKIRRNTFDNKLIVERSPPRPCQHCEKLNKGIRFHPEEKCWFKHTTDYETKKYYNKNVNNTVLDVELKDHDPKNE